MKASHSWWYFFVHNMHSIAGCDQRLESWAATSCLNTSRLVTALFCPQQNRQYYSWLSHRLASPILQPNTLKRKMGKLLIFSHVSVAARLIALLHALTTPTCYGSDGILAADGIPWVWMVKKAHVAKVSNNVYAPESTRYYEASSLTTHEAIQPAGESAANSVWRVCPLVLAKNHTHSWREWSLTACSLAGKGMNVAMAWATVATVPPHH